MGAGGSKSKKFLKKYWIGYKRDNSLKDGKDNAPVKNLFSVFDRDKDGVLALDEARHYVSYLLDISGVKLRLVDAVPPGTNFVRYYEDFTSDVLHYMDVWGNGTLDLMQILRRGKNSKLLPLLRALSHKGLRLRRVQDMTQDHPSHPGTTALSTRDVREEDTHDLISDVFDFEPDTHSLGWDRSVHDFTLDTFSDSSDDEGSTVTPERSLGSTPPCVANPGVEGLGASGGAASAAVSSVIEAATSWAQRLVEHAWSDASLATTTVGVDAALPAAVGDSTATPEGSGAAITPEASESLQTPEDTLDDEDTTDTSLTVGSAANVGMEVGEPCVEQCITLDHVPWTTALSQLKRDALHALSLCDDVAVAAAAAQTDAHAVHLCLGNNEEALPSGLVPTCVPLHVVPQVVTTADDDTDDETASAVIRVPADVPLDQCVPRFAHLTVPEASELVLRRHKELRWRDLRITVERTLRLPPTAVKVQLPPSFGTMSLLTDATISRMWDAAVGVRDAAGIGPDEPCFWLPCWNREAFWLNFDSSRAYAVRVAVNGTTCAVTGKPWVPGRLTFAHEQNFVACPEQSWIEGVCRGDGTVYQFCGPALAALADTDGAWLTFEVYPRAQEPHVHFSTAPNLVAAGVSQTSPSPPLEVGTGVARCLDASQSPVQQGVEVGSIVWARCHRWVRREVQLLDVAPCFPVPPPLLQLRLRGAFWRLHVKIVTKATVPSTDASILVCVEPRDACVSVLFALLASPSFRLPPKRALRRGIKESAWEHVYRLQVGGKSFPLDETVHQHCRNGDTLDVYMDVVKRSHVSGLDRHTWCASLRRPWCEQATAGHVPLCNTLHGSSLQQLMPSPSPHLGVESRHHHHKHHQHQLNPGDSAAAYTSVDSHGTADDVSDFADTSEADDSSLHVVAGSVDNDAVATLDATSHGLSSRHALSSSRRTVSGNRLPHELRLTRFGPEEWVTEGGPALRFHVRILSRAEARRVSGLSLRPTIAPKTYHLYGIPWLQEYAEDGVDGT